MLKVSDIIVIYRETFKLIKYSVPLIASIEGHFTPKKRTGFSDF